MNNRLSQTFKWNLVIIQTSLAQSSFGDLCLHLCLF